MAEARATEILPAPNLFYCHECTSEIVPQLPDYICPQCRNGFIEPASGQSSSSSSSSVQGTYDSDSDDHSIGSSFDMEDVFEPSFGSLGHFLIGGGDLNGFAGMEVGGEVGVETGASGASSSSSGPRRRHHGRQRGGLLNTLLMGAGNRRSRLRGPDRNTVLAPMIHDLIVHFSTGDPFQLPMFSEELAGDPGDYVWGRGGFDAVITHLMSQLENSGPPPLSEDQIDHIPSVPIDGNQVKNKAQCSVCMEDFVLAEIVKKLRCDHCFHEPCIKPWLQMHATCPVCRKTLAAASDESESSDDAAAEPDPSSSAAPPQQATQPSTASQPQLSQPRINSSRRLLLSPNTSGMGNTLFNSTSSLGDSGSTASAFGAAVAGASASSSAEQASSSTDPDMMEDDDLD